MAWVQITAFGFTWSEHDRRFSIGLWIGPNRTPNPNHNISNLSADEFVGLSTLLRGDADKKLFFDPATGQVTSGVDPV